MTAAQRWLWRQLQNHHGRAVYRQALWNGLKDRLPTTCPVFGCTLDYEHGGRNKNAPSLDKLVPNKGYAVENVRVISWDANRLKQNATLHQLQQIIAHLQENL